MSSDQITFEIVKLVVQFLGAALISWLAVKLAISRYKSEKSWERQIEAYVGIIKSLTELSILKRKMLGNHEANREQSEQETKDFDNKYQENRLKIIEYIAIAKICLPKEISKYFSEIYEEMEKSRDYDDHYIDLYSDLKIVESHIEKMTIYAQKALAQQR